MCQFVRCASEEILFTGCQARSRGTEVPVGCRIEGDTPSPQQTAPTWAAALKGIDPRLSSRYAVPTKSAHAGLAGTQRSGPGVDHDRVCSESRVVDRDDLAVCRVVKTLGPSVRTTGSNRCERCVDLAREIVRGKLEGCSGLGVVCEKTTGVVGVTDLDRYRGKVSVFQLLKTQVR